MEYPVDDVIPEPLDLQQTLQNLDEWSNGAPCSEAFLNLLVADLGLDSRAKSEFQAGSGALLGRSEPVNAQLVEDGELTPPTLIALALGLVVRGEHAIRRYPRRGTARPPEVLSEVEGMARSVVQALELVGRNSKKGTLGQLDDLRGRLQGRRAVVVSGAALNEEKVREKNEELEARALEEEARVREEEAQRAEKEAVRQAEEEEVRALSGAEEAAEKAELEGRLAEDEAKRLREKEEEEEALERAGREAAERRTLERERERETAAAVNKGMPRTGGVSFQRIFIGVAIGGCLLLLAILLPTPGGSLRPASDYSEVPTLGLIRHQDVVIVRIKTQWYRGPLGQRTTQARALWKRLQGEGGDEPIRLELADQTGRMRGWVASGRVRWEAAATENAAKAPTEVLP